MRNKLLIILCLLLSGCATSRSNADREIECLSYGFKPKSDDLSHCVLILIEGDYKHDKMLGNLLSGGSSYAPSSGQPVYGADQCIGAVINGVCHGSIGGAGIPRATCYGEMLNGQCTGPQF